MVALKQARCRAEQQFIEPASLKRQEITDAISEALEVARHKLHLPIHGIGIEPSPYRDTETWVVPPKGVEASMCSND
jgi:hypothetical protein